MKKLFQFSVLAALLSVLLIITACSGNKPDTTQPPANEETSVSLSIAGNDISQYKIVYATSPYASNITNFKTEYDFFKLIAEHVAAQITEQTGVTLPVSQDSATEVSDKEILVGPTNRPESDPLDSLDALLALNKVVGTKLVVGGGYISTKYSNNIKQSYSFASSYHAWDKVKAHIAEQVADGNKSVDLADGFELTGDVGVKFVACIGDSITDGNASSDPIYTAYPAYLQRLLWQDYMVINYGLGGTAMRNDLPYSYKGCDHYYAALEHGEKFDIAMIMLGTNDDSDYGDRDWDDNDRNSFKQSALELVQKLTVKNEDLHVTIMNSPIYYGSNNYSPPRLRALQGELPEFLRREGYTVHFYDMYTTTKTLVGRRNFPDGLHPNDDGYFIMAYELSKAIPQMLGGTWAD